MADLLREYVEAIARANGRSPEWTEEVIQGAKLDREALSMGAKPSVVHPSEQADFTSGVDHATS